MSRCVFLDRDGTIVVDKGYLSDPSRMELIPGSAEGLRVLSENGFLLVVLSNQSGVGRGYFSESDLDDMDHALRRLLAEEGVELAGTYYCVHADDEGCDCRKPRPGLALRAVEDHGIELVRSFVVGDKTSDVMLARNLGCPSVLVSTGMAGSDASFEVEPDHRARDLREAAALIIGNP